MKLIVGLGNIGAQYAKTRHNIGFMVADELAAAQEARWKPNDKFKADIARLELGDTTILIAKPQTMMNLSGEAIQKVMQFYKIAPADVWVLLDDVDVEFGRMRTPRQEYLERRPPGRQFNHPAHRQRLRAGPPRYQPQRPRRGA